VAWISPEFRRCERCRGSATRFLEVLKNEQTEAGIRVVGAADTARVLSENRGETDEKLRGRAQRERLELFVEGGRARQVQEKSIQAGMREAGDKTMTFRPRSGRLLPVVLLARSSQLRGRPSFIPPRIQLSRGDNGGAEIEQFFTSSARPR